MRKGVIRTGALALLLAGGAAGAHGSGRPRPDAGGACSKLPAGKRVVKLNLKPETEVADLVAWISSITCKQFLLPDVPASHAKVTIVAPSLITSGEAYRLFLEALDSVGLTVYPDGRFLRIIETAKAKTYPIPLVGFGADGQDD
jgi:hypothetical protein